MAYPIMHDGLAAALPPIVALLAIAFGAFLAWRVAQVKVRSGSAAGRDAGREYLLEEEARGEDEVSFRCAGGVSLREWGERREVEGGKIGDGDGQRRRRVFFFVVAVAGGVLPPPWASSPLFPCPCLAPLSPGSRSSLAKVLAVRRRRPVEQQARRGCRWWRREKRKQGSKIAASSPFVLQAFPPSIAAAFRGLLLRFATSHRRL